jgi:hypothetical protein
LSKIIQLLGFIADFRDHPHIHAHRRLMSANLILGLLMESKDEAAGTGVMKKNKPGEGGDTPRALRGLLRDNFWLALVSCRDDASMHRGSGSFGAIRNFELIYDVDDVIAHGVVADFQGATNLLVRAAFGQHFQNL